MKEDMTQLRAALESAFASQVSLTAEWHEREAHTPHCPARADACGPDACGPDVCGPDELVRLVLMNHYYNFRLWHIEDEARRKDVDDSVIAECKRNVDVNNQKRNDAIEEVDKCLVSLLPTRPGAGASARQNTETAGMAVDRLSILALKIYHMEEQTRRVDVSAEHIAACSEKLAVLQRQRQDLLRALFELLEDYRTGSKKPVLYSQFKMYNDPNLNPALYSKAR